MVYKAIDPNSSFDEKAFIEARKNLGNLEQLVKGFKSPEISNNDVISGLGTVLKNNPNYFYSLGRAGDAETLASSKAGDEINTGRAGLSEYVLNNASALVSKLNREGMISLLASSNFEVKGDDEKGKKLAKTIKDYARLSSIGAALEEGNFEVVAQYASQRFAKENPAGGDISDAERIFYQRFSGDRIVSSGLAREYLEKDISNVIKTVNSFDDETIKGYVLGHVNASRGKEDQTPVRVLSEIAYKTLTKKEKK